MDSSTHAHTPPKPKSSPGWMITIAAAAAFLATFNETFLNVAFAPIMSDLGVDVNTVQWLTTGYLLVAAVFVPVANVLYRRFPTRSLFIAVTAIMIVGSVIGALAPNFSTLLIGLLLQAIGTGLLTPIGMNPLGGIPATKAGHEHGHHGRDDHAWTITGHCLIRRLADHCTMANAHVGLCSTSSYRVDGWRYCALHRG